MKDDPFSSLSGLDQQLYQEQPNKATTKQRDNATTPPDSNAGSNEAGKPRDSAEPPRRAPAATVVEAKAGESEATRTRVSAARGHRESVRLVDRHSHDIFYDQVRWMNRLKLELEEEYETRVTSNGMVQLAIDMLRRDYEANGEQSALMRSLVFGDAVSMPLPAKRRRR